MQVGAPYSLAEGLRAYEGLKLWKLWRGCEGGLPRWHQLCWEWVQCNVSSGRKEFWRVSWRRRWGSRILGKIQRVYIKVSDLTGIWPCYILVGPGYTTYFGPQLEVHGSRHLSLTLTSHFCIQKMRNCQQTIGSKLLNSSNSNELVHVEWVPWVLWTTGSNLDWWIPCSKLIIKFLYKTKCTGGCKWKIKLYHGSVSNWLLQFLSTWRDTSS